MSDADCTPGREPRSVAASLYWLRHTSSTPQTFDVLPPHTNRFIAGTVNVSVQV